MEVKIKPIPSEDHGIDKKFLRLPHHKVLFKPPFTCHVEGMIGSGKTSWVYSMLNTHYKKYFDEVVVYCGTLDSKEYWEKLPHKNVVVIHQWNPTEFYDYTRQLEIDQEKRKEDGKRMLNVCMVFDDMASEGLSKKSGGAHSPLERLMLICRHLNCSVIIATQDSKICMNPAMRNNCFYHVLYRVQKNDIEKIAKEHAGDLTVPEFLRLYYSIMNSAPYQFMIIDYKATPEKRFRHGFKKIVKPIRDVAESSSSEEENGRTERTSRKKGKTERTRTPPKSKDVSA
jgi:hypothetical protein